MEPLEAVLRKVEDLRRDLTAEKVVGKKQVKRMQERYETDEEMGLRQNCALSETATYRGRDTVHTLVDAMEDVKQPHIEKRESAKTQLQHIYDSSEWYSARYVAGNCLSVSSTELEGKLKEWIIRLMSDLDVITAISVPSTLAEDGYDPISNGHSYNPTTQRNKIVSDTEKRKQAIKDTGNLFALSFHHNAVRDLLQNTYDKNSDRGTREEAGRYLGKSKLAIWFHELVR
jgi:hypothetical protein